MPQTHLGNSVLAPKRAAFSERPSPGVTKRRGRIGTHCWHAVHGTHCMAWQDSAFGQHHATCLCCMRPALSCSTCMPCAIIGHSFLPAPHFLFQVHTHLTSYAVVDPIIELSLTPSPHNSVCSECNKRGSECTPGHPGWRLVARCISTDARQLQPYSCGAAGQPYHTWRCCSTCSGGRSSGAQVWMAQKRPQSAPYQCAPAAHQRRQLGPAGPC